MFQNFPYFPKFSKFLKFSKFPNLKISKSILKSAVLLASLMPLLIKVDRFKHDNLKISKEKLESLSLSGNDYVGHVKPKQTKERPLMTRDNLKLATGKLEDLTTSNTDFKVGSQCYTKAVHVTVKFAHIKI